MDEPAPERRRLGPLAISRLGFGAWAAGGPGHVFAGTAADDAATVAAMRHAFARGVNWVDTAPTYGSGHSEEITGRAVGVLSGAHRPLVFTKCGRRWDGPDTQPYSDLRPEAIGADCDASLRRLRVDVIDLLQIHWPERVERARLEDSWGALLRLVEAGKIRAAGVCNFDVARLERCDAIGHVDSLQAPVSMIRREAAGVLAWCAAHGTAVIAYSPMQVGLLTDGFTRSHVERLAVDDWRRHDAEFGPYLERNLALRDALRPLARAHGTSVAAVAVAWTLRCRGVTAAVVGARNVEQVDGWIGAATVKLGEADVDAIAAAISRTGAGGGPVRL